MRNDRDLPKQLGSHKPVHHPARKTIRAVKHAPTKMCMKLPIVLPTAHRPLRSARQAPTWKRQPITNCTGVVNAHFTSSSAGKPSTCRSGCNQTLVISSKSWPQMTGQTAAEQRGQAGQARACALSSGRKAGSMGSTMAVRNTGSVRPALQNSSRRQRASSARRSSSPRALRPGHGIGLPGPPSIEKNRLTS